MKFNCLTKLIPIAVLAVGFAASSLAQAAGPTSGTLAPPANSAHHGKHPIIQALSGLNLSGAQKTQIEGMLKQRKADNKAFRKANQRNMPALKAHAKQETEAFLTSLKSVLTQPQWRQFEANLRALKGKGTKRNQIPPTTPPQP